MVKLHPSLQLAFHTWEQKRAIFWEIWRWTCFNPWTDEGDSGSNFQFMFLQSRIYDLLTHIHWGFIQKTQRNIETQMLLWTCVFRNAFFFFPRVPKSLVTATSFQDEWSDWWGRAQQIMAVVNSALSRSWAKSTFSCWSFGVSSFPGLGDKTLRKKYLRGWDEYSSPPTVKQYSKNTQQFSSNYSCYTPVI